MVRSLPSARTYRLLAVPLGMPSRAATSSLLSSSKWRSERTSRSSPVHRLDGPREDLADLVPRGGLARRGQVAGEPRGEVGGAGVRRAPAEADLAAGVARLGPEVATVGVDQPLVGEQADPDGERHLGPLAVVVEPALGREVDLLHDVRRREPTAEPRVEPAVHPAPEPVLFLARRTATPAPRGRRTGRGPRGTRGRIRGPASTPSRDGPAVSATATRPILAPRPGSRRGSRRRRSSGTSAA